MIVKIVVYDDQFPVENNLRLKQTRKVSEGLVEHQSRLECFTRSHIRYRPLCNYGCQEYILVINVFPAPAGGEKRHGIGLCWFRFSESDPLHDVVQHENVGCDMQFKLSPVTVIYSWMKLNKSETSNRSRTWRTLEVRPTWARMVHIKIGINRI